ncbi:ferrous iron transport protein A [Tessaracoccus sp. OH4464_COT-324]|uniref:FeoA family protein n=1 Tax=Tessaracoccus sp. OH4464_COT-324 TaxID=2491059 RepID=UPI000F63F304|nr:ferrous iron transport protein A [Tessaracoccus sp. OH4464_COT-324]RRD45591.1 ferrous iron transport protein A [Tessaracoccus sp. OH4464_COT-324]
MSAKTADAADNLAACVPGQQVTVLRVKMNDYSAPTVRRLAEIGIRPGAKVEAGQKTAGGGRVVCVAGAQIALDSATLKSIEVTSA